MLTSVKSQKGFSLVELMVGLTVGLMVIAAASAMYITTSASSRDTLNSARLNIGMRAAMDMMVDEIRRAGYSNDPGSANEFTQTTTGAITDLVISNSGSCIEFSYDADTNGDLSTASPFEFFGFRVQNGVLQYRNGGSGFLGGCNTGNWQPVTDDESITIVADATNNYFSVAYQCLNTDRNESVDTTCPSTGTFLTNANADAPVDLLETKVITITLNGQLVANTDFKMRLEQEVLVRNGRIVLHTSP